MDISPISNLCLRLISAAFQRCCVCEDLCRLSVVLLESSPSLNPPLVQISISDTGIGSSSEEFLDLKCAREGIGAEKFDGLLSVRTTSVSDNEIRHYDINLREFNSGRMITRLPSKAKNGAKFSGTEVRLSAAESIDILVKEINCFFRKMLILKIPNVAIELVVECEDVPRSRCENVFLANESNPLPFSTSNIARLRSGLEDYVLKHGNSLNSRCSSCFPSGEHLKAGIGTSCSSENHSNAGMVMEVVIIISESEQTSPCFRTCSKTEVLYFKDFAPCLISQSSLNALAGIDWKSYGLTLKSVEDQGGYVLEWENLPSHVHIDIVLHCYHKQVMIPSVRHKTQSERSLTKRAVKMALNDLKENHAAILLSSHALKICSYAPDLARSIAGLIRSSNDPEFQRQCLSLIGLRSGETGGSSIEDCIKEKIIGVIEMNDRKSQKSQDSSAFLFEDECCQEPTFHDQEYESGEDEFIYLD